MDDPKAPRSADDELVDRFDEGRIMTAHFHEAVKISSGIFDATRQELVAVTEDSAYTRFIAAGVCLVAARIAARLSPPPEPNETARETVQRAARDCDQEAVRFLSCSSEADFLAAFPDAFNDGYLANEE